MTDCHNYLTAWMSQFDTKDTCIEFVINSVSLHTSNVKIKFDLKVEEICRGFSLFFCEISDNAQGFCLVLLETL